MLHACVQRFDVMKNFEKICKILGTKQAPRLLKRSKDGFYRFYGPARFAEKPWLKVPFADLL